MGLLWKSKAERAAEAEAAAAEKKRLEAEQEAARKKRAAEQWEIEITRIRTAVAEAIKAGGRFLVVEHNDHISYARFVKAVVAIANESSAEALSFTHSVWGGSYTTRSDNECAVITLPGAAANRMAA